MKRLIAVLSLGLLGGFLGTALYFHFANKIDPADSVDRQRIETLIAQKLAERDGQPMNGTPVMTASYGRSASNSPPLDFTLASERSTKSVVYIKTITQGRAQADYFDYFFGNGAGRTQELLSSGSGVIFSQDGYIVTNNHVVDGAVRIEVLHGRRTYEAKMVGIDPSTDLALLKVEATGLPAISLSSSYDLNVGEWVLAVGNPFNLTSTVTAGIVSAKSRNINVVNARFPLEAFIQTDAAINPGNSGGALVNLEGELVGINTAILSRTGTYAGYGFAVPVDIVSKVVNDLIKHGEVQKAFVGAMIHDFTSTEAERLNVSSLDGVLVTMVNGASAAEQAGIKADDIILSVNSRPVNSRAAFDEQIGNFKPGDKVQVTLRRGGKVMNKELTLLNREGTTDLLHRELVEAVNLGADLEELSKVERSQLRIAEGVKVVNIRQGMFLQLNMEEGFIVTAVNRRSVKDPKELIGVLENLRGRVVIEGISTKGQRGYYSGYIR